MITLAKIVFILTIITYIVALVSMRSYTMKRVIITSFLLNCLSQAYLICNGIYSYTVAFLIIEATEAVLAGILSEKFISTAQKIIARINGTDREYARERQYLISALENALKTAPDHKVYFQDFWLNNSDNGKGEDVCVSALGYHNEKLGLYMQNGDFWYIDDLSVYEMRLCLDELRDIDE